MPADQVGPRLKAERAARLARWKAEIAELQTRIWTLQVDRRIWTETRQALADARPEDGTFLSHYARVYTTHQLVALRRLADPDPRSVSLTGLLTELAEHPETMTREAHLELWNLQPEGERVIDEWLAEEAERTFNDYADADGDNVDPDRVRADLGAWQSLIGPIKKLVDKRIAHAARNPGKVPKVTYDDIDRTIDQLASQFKRYALLFTGSSPIGEPTFQGDWTEPLRAPLFEPYKRPPTHPTPS